MTDEREAEVIRVLKETNYYRILNVTPEVCKDPKILKSAKNKILMKIHPDKCNHERASEAFQKVNKAYDVLSDERQREIYDQFGEEGPRKQTRARYQQQYYQQDPFAHMFGEMFRANMERGHRNQNYNGQRPQLTGLITIMIFIVILFGGNGGLSLFKFSNPFTRDKLKGILSFESIPNAMQRHSAKYRTLYYIPSWWLSQIGGVREAMLRDLDKVADKMWEEEIEIQCELEVNVLKSEGKKCAAMKRVLGRGRRAN